MPQMKPMNWMILFLTFMTILITKISINFFVINYKINKLNNLEMSSTQTSWKW